MGLSTAALYNLRIVKGATFSRLITLSDQATAVVHNIVGVDTASNKWKIRGDYTNVFGVGKSFLVTNNSTTANGRYVVTAVGLVSGITEITVGSIDADAFGSGQLRRELNEPMNLSGYTFTAEIRDSAGGALLGTFTVAATSEDGQISMTMSATETAALDFETGVYDVKFTDGSGTVAYWLQGEVTLEIPVTE